MSLSNALNISLSGLNVTQRGLDVVAGNIANAETEGYTRKTINQYTLSADDRVIGVRAAQVDRVLNEQVQTDLRRLAGDNVYNDITADFLNRLDVAFGEPGSPTALDQTFNDALASLEALSTTPEDYNLQLQSISDLRVFTGQLNSLSETIQGLRQEADAAIADTVLRINDALQGIDDVNGRIIVGGSNAPNEAFLEDERDQFIDELSQLLDINVTKTPTNGVTIQTTSGVTLYSGRPYELEFSPAGTVVPASTRENGILSTVNVSINASSVITDLYGPVGVKGGALAAYGELRDTVLVQAQSQLDAFAAELALSVSTLVEEGTEIPGGFTVDTANFAEGNRISLEFTEASGTTRNVTLVQVTDPNRLPLEQDFTADPNDIVIGIDFSSATAAADLQTALAAEAPTAGIVVTEVAGVFSFTGAIPAVPAEATVNISDFNTTDTFDLVGVDGTASINFLDGDRVDGTLTVIDGSAAGQIELNNLATGDTLTLSDGAGRSFTYTVGASVPADEVALAAEINAAAAAANISTISVTGDPVGDTLTLTSTVGNVSFEFDDLSDTATPATLLTTTNGDAVTAGSGTITNGTGAGELNTADITTDDVFVINDGTTSLNVQLTSGQVQAINAAPDANGRATLVAAALTTQVNDAIAAGSPIEDINFAASGADIVGTTANLNVNFSITFTDDSSTNTSGASTNFAVNAGETDGLSAQNIVDQINAQTVNTGVTAALDPVNANQILLTSTPALPATNPGDFSLVQDPTNANGNQATVFDTSVPPATSGDVTTAFEAAQATTSAVIDGVTARVSETSLTSSTALPLFQDGEFGGSFTDSAGPGGIRTGFASRIAVSRDVIDDPSLISRFQPTTSNSGDASRVNFILDQMRGETRIYAPETGLGAPAAPIQATSADFLQTIITTQGQKSSSAQRSLDASQISFNNVQQRFQSETAVNIDQELAQLIELEQAFQANARVLSTVQQMQDALFSAFR